jgi:hypothetical protein
VADSPFYQTDEDPTRAERVAKRCIACPHCNELLLINLSTTVHMSGVPDEVLSMQPDDLQPSQRELLDESKSSGVFQAWYRAASDAFNGAMAPAKADRAFLRFWSRAFRRELRPEVVAILRERGDAKGRYVSALHFQDVVAIFDDGRLVGFYPVGAVIGRDGKNIKAKDRRAPDTTQLERWIKTRHGYVPAQSRVFAESMQRRSAGAFADIHDSVRNR